MPWRFCFAFTVVLMSVGSWAADWPGYRGPGTDGVAAAASLNKLALTPVWKASTGDAFGQIAVTGDRALMMTERGDDEVCLCLNAATGQETWATRIGKTIKDANGDGPRSTPTIDGQFVYCQGTYLKLACLDLQTGKEVWKHDLVAEMGGKPLGWGNAASPRVVGDVVLVVGGGRGKGICAFNKTTGELAWARTDEKYTHATPTVATILGKLQVICFMQSGLVSVDPANGQVLWTFKHPYKASTAASPVVGGKDGDIVYCSAGYGVGAAACRITHDDQGWSAKTLWSTPGKNLSHWSTPVYYDGCLYGLFGHNDNNGPLACLDIQTGKVLWTQPGFGSQGGLVLVGDKLLVQTPKGALVLAKASPDGYQELGRSDILPPKDWTAPTFVDGNVYARNSSSQQGKSDIVCLKVGE
jgi:outer membrane protein assembly factor BamB